MADKNIRTMFIFEMMGKPPEYIKESMENYIKSLETDEVKVLSKKIHDCKPIENDKLDVKGLYTTFAEVELEVSNLNLLFGIVFRLLPSHVEILEPAELYLKNFDLSAIITDLAVKLHKYDEVVKIVAMERDNFARQLNEIHGNIIKNVKVEEVKNENIEKKDVKTDKKKKVKKK
jgi:hypothetical protein